MKVLFLDCFSGISGDMTVGALCDLGVKPSTLEWELSKVELGDFHMHFERKHRHNIEGVAFGIHEGATHAHAQDEHEHEEAEHEHTHECEGHGHEHHHHHHEEHTQAHGDAAELPPHDHEHGDEVGHRHHHHDDEHEHGHGHSHEHEHHHVHGRSHHEIRELITKSELSEYVKMHALSIFQRIAVAEGKIHGMPPETVQFHEVGALDSIADIVCVCAGLEALGVEKVYVSALHDGTGWIDCAHGRFPLPAPATLEILKGVPIGQIDEAHELITPTGAAIVAEFGAGFGLMPRLIIEKIGYGIGSRKLESRPNVLRAVLGELAEA